MFSYLPVKHIPNIILFSIKSQSFGILYPLPFIILSLKKNNRVLLWTCGSYHIHGCNHRYKKKIWLAMQLCALQNRCLHITNIKKSKTLYHHHNCIVIHKSTKVFFLATLCKNHPLAVAGFFKGSVYGNTKKFYEAAIFGKTYKIIPKHIVFYSIGSYYCTISTTVFKKISTQIFQFQLHLNSCCSSVSYSSSADSRVFSACSVTLCLLFAFYPFQSQIS